MMERRQIVRLLEREAPSVLVTLIRVEGSSYRRPGAHLLISNNGEYAGTISGGCLETEVLRKAVWKVREGAVVEHYSTVFDDTDEIPFGLGCGGEVDLLLEPADTPECQALLKALQASLEGQSRSVITWLPASGHSLYRAVMDQHGSVLFASSVLTPVMLKEALQAPTLASEQYFFETLEVPQRLFILGAGEDARPLVSMAALLGWQVIVADGRSHLARRERFPEAEEVIVLTDTTQLEISPQDAVVLMTHSYEQDRDLLVRVLPKHPRYLGLLGARHRSSLLVSEAAAMLSVPLAQCCERIYAPVGLDLGGDGPEAIALAVLAEAHACCMGKIGVSRRLTPEEVAVQIQRGGASLYLQQHCSLDIAH